MRAITESVRSENMIPVVRARLAMSLKRQGLRVTEIAAALNTTPAAVVQYLKGKRGIGLFQYSINTGPGNGDRS